MDTQEALQVLRLLSSGPFPQASKTNSSLAHEQQHPRAGGKPEKKDKCPVQGAQGSQGGVMPFTSTTNKAEKRGTSEQPAFFRLCHVLSSS